MLREYDVVSHDLIKYLTGYNATDDKMKKWKYQPQEYIITQRDDVTKIFHSIKTSHLIPFTKFQPRIVHMINPGCMKAFILWIHVVSTHDEITIGFSLAIGEILEMIGLVVAKKDENNQASLHFSEDYSQNTIFLRRYINS